MTSPAMNLPQQQPYKPQTLADPICKTKKKKQNNKLLRQQHAMCKRNQKTNQRSPYQFMKKTIRKKQAWQPLENMPAYKNPREHTTTKLTKLIRNPLPNNTSKYRSK
jgi:hypothetical protein